MTSFHVFSGLFVRSIGKKWPAIDFLFNKEKITRWREDVSLIFSC